MKSKHLSVLAMVPFLIAADSGRSALIDSFLADVQAGAEFSAVLYKTTPTGELANFLKSLKGCKKKLIEPLSKEAIGVQWRCKDKPKSRAAVMYVESDKIARILPSTVTRATVESSQPIKKGN